MGCYGWEPLMVSYHPAKPCDHKYYGNEHVIFLVSYMVSQDYTTMVAIDTVVVVM